MKFVIVITRDYWSLPLQLDADDAKVVLEEEPGVDVYAESQMPL